MLYIYTLHPTVRRSRTENIFQHKSNLFFSFDQILRQKNVVLQIDAVQSVDEGTERGVTLFGVQSSKVSTYFLKSFSANFLMMICTRNATTNSPTIAAIIAIAVCSLDIMLRKGVIQVGVIYPLSYLPPSHQQATT